MDTATSDHMATVIPSPGGKLLMVTRNVHMQPSRKVSDCSQDDAKKSNTNQSCNWSKCLPHINSSQPACPSQLVSVFNQQCLAPQEFSPAPGSQTLKRCVLNFKMMAMAYDQQLEKAEFGVKYTDRLMTNEVSKACPGDKYMGALNFLMACQYWQQITTAIFNTFKQKLKFKIMIHIYVQYWWG